MKRRANSTALVQKAIKSLHASTGNKKQEFPQFQVGDTVRIHVKVKEGEKTRIQMYEGLVIRCRKGGAGASFTVRKISYGIGVERIFPFMSPVIDRITLVSKGDVRRAKLYYLRALSGRASKVKSELVFGSDAGSTSQTSSKGASDAEGPELTAKAAEA